MGQREYSITLEVLAGREELQRAMEAAWVAAGGRFDATEHGSFWSFGADPDGSAWFGSLEAAEGPRGTLLSLRIRPQPLGYQNFWPAARLRQAIAEVVRAHPAYVQGSRAEAEPRDVGPDELPALLRAMTDPARALALLVLTPGPYGTPEVAAQLARDLAGIALVRRLTSADVARALSASTGKERGVYGGAARLYRPGFRLDSDPLDHDLLLAMYIDTRRGGGEPLDAEFARRLLPPAASPIARPAAVPGPAQPPLAPSHPAPAPAALPVPDLEPLVERLRAERDALTEANRRLKRALDEAEHRVRELESLVPTSTIPGVPWPMQNPAQWAVELAPGFERDLATAARDGSLAAEVRKKMEAVLLAPGDYGKEMRGERRGQRATYVARNYRLVWSFDGKVVRFVLIVSKEDIEYSPHGA